MTRRARAREDTITFPKLHSQVQATRLVVAHARTSAPHQMGSYGEHLQTTVTTKELMSSTDSEDIVIKSVSHHCADCSQEFTQDGNGAVRVKKVINAVPTGERVTTQAKYNGDITDRKYLGRDRPIRHDVARYDVARRQHMTFEAVTLPQSPQTKYQTPRPLKSILKPVNLPDITQQKEAGPKHPTQLKTDGDRLVPARRAQRISGGETVTREQIEYIPYCRYTQSTDVTSTKAKRPTSQGANVTRTPSSERANKTTPPRAKKNGSKKKVNDQYKGKTINIINTPRGTTN